MKWILAAWSKFWFLRSRRHPLGLLRAVVALWCLLAYVPACIAIAGQDAEIAPELFVWTVGSRLLPLPYPPTGAWLAACKALLYITGIAAVLGLATRLCTLVFSLGLLYFLSGFASHSLFNHAPILPVQVLLILAFAPGGAAWSLDRWIVLFRRRRPRSPRRWFRGMQGPPVDLWGLKLILILLVVVYGSAGVSKLRYSGGRWLDGETLRYYLDGRQGSEHLTTGQVFLGDPRLDAHRSWKDGAGLVDHAYGYGATPLGRWMARSTRWTALLATGTVLFELSAVLLLAGQPWRNLYLLGAWAMHGTMGLTMGLPFRDYRIIVLCLIDWRSLGRGRREICAWFRRRRA